MAAIPVVLIGHGSYPEGVRGAIEMILGEQPCLATVSLPPDGSTERLAEEVRAALRQLGSEGGEALVLADLMGGSPSNAVGALALADPTLQLVSGLNLPMALEVLTSAAETAEDLAATAVHAGKAGVMDVAATLREAARGVGS
ncbi:MAG: PTS sugar transporter subunit IIA [Sciscionella sp.]